MTSGTRSALAQSTHLERRGRLRNPSPRLRVGLVQAICAFVGLLLALIAAPAPWGPTFPSASLVPIMIAMAFSVVGLVTIIFSLLFTVVEWTYATFSLRLRRFESRRLTWWAFGLAIGIFVYSIAAAGLTVGQERVSWVVPGIAILATLVGLVLMRRVQLDAFASVQLGRTLVDLCAEGLEAVRENYPDPLPDVAASRSVDAPIDTSGVASGVVVTWQGPPAVLQELDEAKLVAELEKRCGTCVFTVGVGDFLSPGMPIATATVDAPFDLTRFMVTGVDRTPTQDALLPALVIVDIGLKALSTALNDPKTAVQSLDALEPILVELAVRDLDTGTLRDRSGSVVATLPMPSWDDILSQLVDDLVVCAALLPTPSLRLARLLDAVELQAVSERKPAVAVRRRQLTERSAGIRRTLSDDGA